MTEDFSNYPISIAERKAEKANSAGEWTPRDALIAALRDIDNGKFNPTHLVVVLATVPEDEQQGTKMDYFNCFPNSFYAIGMLTAGINYLMGNCRGN